MNRTDVDRAAQSTVRFLLITANTGTIFEKPELLTAWVIEFANLLRCHPSDFIALHCQEVGGKDYERFMHVLDTFIKDILQIPEIDAEFTRYRLYFDSDYTSQDTFTALGSAYFIRRNIPLEQWNFTTSSFANVVDRQIYTGNLINAQTLRKEKFAREFFSEAKWSRKGFTQTRWSINNFVFDMVNVHLFHDASNIVAAEQSPSVYSGFRKNALQYTLQRLPLDPAETPVPYAIFGDFNFRLDTKRLIQNIADTRNGCVNRIKQANNDEISKIIIENAQNKTKLIIEKKEFNLHDDHDVFFSHDIDQFQAFDFEVASFTDELFEFARMFPPSYPYSEEFHEPRSYLRARCPAWCDRVLLSHTFKQCIDTESSAPAYNVIGKEVCMGDHKPVYLAVMISSVQGSSASPASVPDSVSPPSSFFSTNPENQPSPTNDEDNTVNPLKSPVTALRETDPNARTELIVNETPIPADELELFNVHDYALFVQPALVPQWWFEKLHQRASKSSTNSNTTSKLWTKVRAVAFMATLGHRTGSWYSDDRTEQSPSNDQSSLSDVDDNDQESSHRLPFDLNEIEPEIKSDLPPSLRRSFSSINYINHPENYASTLSRSRSTTLISSSDYSPDSPSIEAKLPTLEQSSAPTPTAQQQQIASSSRVYRFLHCIIL